jgi:hypothetical protein
MLPNSVSLPPSTWSKVKAISAVLKTKLNQGEEKDLVICESLQRCFDVLVEDQIEQGINLDFALLHQTIPDKALESAVALEWLEPAWAPQNIAWGYREWFMRLLEGRIEYFEACEIGRPFGHDHQKPGFVVKPMPEPDDPVLHLFTNPVPPIQTQPAGQVVYADEIKEPGRAVPTVEARATELAERLEAMRKTGQANEQPDSQQTYRLPEEVWAAVCEYAYPPSRDAAPAVGGTTALGPEWSPDLGQVVYADDTKEPGRAVPIVEVSATVLAARLEEATVQITESVPNASPRAEKKALRLNVELIKAWINEESWTNATLAEELNISERVVSSLRNNGAYHGVEAVTKLANLMKREPDELYLP